MEARKLNKVYQIDEREAQAWADDGYDIYNRGRLVQRGSGKTVPLGEYDKLQAENAGLKDEAEGLRAEITKMKAENANLKGQITKLKKAAN